MTKERAAIAHRDDVVMKNAGIDDLRQLLREHGCILGKTVQSSHRATRFECLASGKSFRLQRSRPVFATAINEEFDTLLAVFAAKARVIRRAFIAERGRSGQRMMNPKAGFVGENRRK